ncbi:MAG: hypothetical protein L6R38_000027 [Xanthoria sp. 2 TBL-2021]|nr:MAG: hypothetical protein L6R38_000027 [Xanthoria sp. 2 TBL-2021]
MLLIYSLLTNLTLLFDIIFVGLGLFAIKKLDGRDLELGFARATTSQLYTGLFVIAVPLFIWANPISSALCFFRGGGLGGRPRTPQFTPPWGRSSWSKPRARREPQERHFEEIESDDDDGQGVTLDGTYFSDDLDLTGPELGRHTRIRRKHIQEPDSQSSEEEGEPLDSRSSGTMQLALRNKADLLLQQALGRIQRAQMLGKHNVKLSKPEIEALERKRRQDESQTTQDKPGSRQADRRRSSSQLNSSAKESIPGKRRSAGMGSNFERTYASDGRAATPPGIMVPGPDGRPIHTPIGYHPLASNQAPGSRGSRSGSRSGSSASLQQSTPPLPSSQYWSPQPRYPSEFQHTPPPPPARNSPSLRRLPDDPQWNPRPRSASSNQPYPGDLQYYQQYSPPPVPNSSQGRRIVSVPAEIQHPSLRRPMAMSSAHIGSSEPTLQRRAHSGGQYNHRVDAEESDDDDENYGVQVDVSPYPYGYEVRRGHEQARPRQPR